MIQCLQCKSQCVITGSVVSAENGVRAAFRPPNLRFLAITLTQGPQLAKKGYACLACGLVWSSASPDKLASFIRKHCDKTSAHSSA
jgi:hypothetical protein